MVTITDPSLFEASLRVRAAAAHDGQATNASVRREWDAMDAELTARGIPTYDRHGQHRNIWWTAQTVAGRILGKWAVSLEEVVIELGATWAEPIAWCVEDPDGEISRRYFRQFRTKQSGPTIAPVTDGPLPGPYYAPLTTLF